MIKLDKVSKIYYNNGVIGTGFSKVSTEFKMGEFVAILGESGSGKSTLLNVISGLDSYEEGEMYINGEETSHYSEEDFEEYRRKYVANIFQAFNLVNSYSVRQNVELVLLINGNETKKIKERVDDILKRVGLWELRNKKVSKLSGGQKQRVAIARALAKETPIIVADEPTGNLDQESAKSIFKLLNEISKDKLVIVVTHNFDQVKDYATRILRMHDGKLVEDKKVKKTETFEAHESQFKKMSLASKFKLSMRNAFNVLPKFLIILAVFIIVTITILGNYASIKSDEYSSFVDDVYWIFGDNAPERVIANKKDKGSISDDDLKKIENLEIVDKIKKNDFLYDVLVNFNFKDDYYVEGNIANIKDLSSKLSRGRMPKNDNEIVVLGNKDHFDFSTFYIAGWFDTFGNLSLDFAEYGENIKIVGIVYDDDVENHTFYVSDKLMNFVKNYYLLDCNEAKINVGELNLSGGASAIISLSEKVPKGEIYVSQYEDKNGILPHHLNELVEVNLKSMYSNSSGKFKFTKILTEDEAKDILGTQQQGSVLINPNDLYTIIKDENYQISVYTKNVDDIDTLKKELDKLGYNGYAVKDSGYVDSELLAIFKFISYFTSIFVVIILFSVSYYVIYLVLKSRVTYFAVVRMLGGNVKLNRELVNYELFIEATLGFVCTLGLVLLTHNGLIKIEALQEAIKFLKVGHFILVYLVLILMSQMIAHKYARKIFKDSMITTYNMEV